MIVKVCRQLSLYHVIDIYSAVAINCSQSIRTRLIADQPPCKDDTDSEVEYPLTPPLSDSSESRPLSPDYDGHLGVVSMQVAELQSRKPIRLRNVLKRRKRKSGQYQFYTTKPQIHLAKNDVISMTPLTLNLVSRGSSKPAIASVAQYYARTGKRLLHRTNAFELSVDELGSTLQGMSKGVNPCI